MIFYVINLRLQHSFFSLKYNFLKNKFDYHVEWALAVSAAPATQIAAISIVVIERD